MNMYAPASMANMSEDVGSAVVRMDATGTEKEEEVVAEEALEVEEFKGNYQQLLQLLKGELESVSAAGKSLGAIAVRCLYGYTGIKSWLFDKADSSYEPFEEWQMNVGTQEMHRLLERIGNCKTLRLICAYSDEDFFWYRNGSLLEALLSPMQSNPVLDSISISSPMDGDTWERICQVLGRILQASLTLKSLCLDLSWFFVDAEILQIYWRSLGHWLTSSCPLERLGIKVSWGLNALRCVNNLLNAVDRNEVCVRLYCADSDIRDWDPTAERRDEEGEDVFTDVKKPVLEFRLTGVVDMGYGGWPDLCKLLGSQMNAFSSIHLRMERWFSAWDMEFDIYEEDFYQALRDTSTLRLLTLDGTYGDMSPGEWKKLVDCLHVNTSITHLNLIHCYGLDDDVFKQLMGVLQVNLTLKRIRLIGTSWETDGKKALIEEALMRNARQDSYFSILRGNKLQFHPAINGRLFLCGSPFAGKTRLRHTMTRFLSGRCCLGGELWRTEGIQVELFKNAQDMQIAIWDLAGQLIFRTLQDILFPRANRSSIFLFMFSPYDRERKRITVALDDRFMSELKEWLQFIASNSQVTEQMLPKVLVVISHKDKMKDLDASWAQRILNKLREEYKGIIDISEKLYLVDARSKAEVAPLKDYICQMFRELLEQITLVAPSVCFQISSELAKRTKDVRHRPVWSSKEFYSFCFDSLPETTSRSMVGSDVLEAMASYLHDTGSVIIIGSLDRIIVDPNWLTNTFLGELITTGHNFQITRNAVQTFAPVTFDSDTGFVSFSDLQYLLSSFLGEHPELEQLDKSLLEELLIHLDLCYKIEDIDASIFNHQSSSSTDSRKPSVDLYYVPTIVAGDPSLQDPLKWSSPPWSSPLERHQEFFGFRVQCDNPRRMSMTAALFPRFQIHLRRKLMTDPEIVPNLTEKQVFCSRDRMHLLMDGMEVFVERSDRSRSHIDVMVKCSKLKPRRTTYIQKHVVDELSTFCASPKGCPGVTLVVGVLRTECVAELVPLEHRGEGQAILTEKLKENFENYVMQHLKETSPVSHSSIRSVLKYQHFWPRIPRELPDGFELAEELLPESEFQKVMRKIAEKQEQELKQVHQTLEEMNHDDDMDQVQDQSAPRMVAEVGTRSTPAEDKDQCSTSRNTPSRSYTMRFDRLDRKIDRLDRKIDERFDRLESMLERIVTLQDQLHSSLVTFMSTLDRKIGYAESRERSETPKRPYLSFKDIRIFHKVKARIRLGTPAKLHFMCESILGPHKVKDQPGLDLSVEKDNLEWVRCICHVSTKMLYYLGKAALNKLLPYGLGDAVCESVSLGDLPVSIGSDAVEGISEDHDMVSLERSGKMHISDITEAWSRLRSYLEPDLNNKCKELFKLNKVKYSNWKEGGYAWACDQCVTRGDSRQ